MWLLCEKTALFNSAHKTRLGGWVQAEEFCAWGDGKKEGTHTSAEGREAPWQQKVFFVSEVDWRCIEGPQQRQIVFGIFWLFRKCVKKMRRMICWDFCKHEGWTVMAVIFGSGFSMPMLMAQPERLRIGSPLASKVDWKMGRWSRNLYFWVFYLLHKGWTLPLNNF